MDDRVACVGIDAIMIIEGMRLSGRALSRLLSTEPAQLFRPLRVTIPDRERYQSNLLSERRAAG